MTFEVPREKMREVVNEVKPYALREQLLRVRGRFEAHCRAMEEEALGHFGC